MILTFFACVMSGATTTASGYQIILTGNMGWAWLLVLNVVWIVLGAWGISYYCRGVER